jgi:hypothetical protein
MIHRIFRELRVALDASGQFHEQQTPSKTAIDD